MALGVIWDKSLAVWLLERRGAGLGTAICGPACGIVGGLYGAVAGGAAAGWDASHK